MSPTGREQQMSRLPVLQVERLRLVCDNSRDEAALTIVADASPAYQAHRDIARLGEFQQALVRPSNSTGHYPATRERDEGADVEANRRPMWSLHRSAGDARRQRFARR